MKDEKKTKKELIEELNKVREQLQGKFCKYNCTRNQFLANISHGLRTPLNTILGYSELLTEQYYGELNEEQRRLMVNIDDNGHQILLLINDIIDLTKIEAGQLELQKSVVLLPDICVQCIESVQPSVSEKNLKFNQMHDGQVSTILADEFRLKQIITNLLTVAIQFTSDSGTIGIEVEGDVAGKMIRITMWSSGNGLAKSAFEDLFNPFVQFEKDVPQRHYGNGITLPLIYRLTELHGGSLTVDTESKKGNRFIITLPWTKEKDHEFLIDKNLRRRFLNSEIRQAMIVEDSPSAVQKIRYLLSQLNIKVVIHTHEEGILEKVLKIKPDVIFLDLILHDEPNWPIVEQLTNDLRTQHIPVIIVSVMDEREKGVKLGAADYIVKPFTSEDLESALQRIAIEKSEKFISPFRNLKKKPDYNGFGGGNQFFPEASVLSP